MSTPADPTAHGVEIRGLSVSYHGQPILRGLDLQVPRGEFLVLLGASGCGKSTLLNAIAGFNPAGGGSILINGRDVTDAEPRQRGIGMVFQSYALYPRMTVAQNLSFALRVAGVKRDEIARRVSRAAAILQLEPLLQRKPAALSGGQRQRVAIGRALVREVDLFLFDEPLSNLDSQLRAELRLEIKQIHQRLGNTMIYVTHDQVEAMTLADRVAVLRDGVIQQLDAPAVIFNRPANRYVAGFVGSPKMNFLPGTLTEQDGERCFRFASGRSQPLSHYHFSTKPPASGTTAELGIRPEYLTLVADGAARAVLTAEVTLVEFLGSEAVVWLQAEGQSLAVRTQNATLPQPGDRVGLVPAAERLSLFDASTGLRL